MLIWEQTPDGYMEVLVNDCYGVVGLAGPRTGWTARVDGPCGRQTAPVLFHTAPEAREWVERQLNERCSEPDVRPAPAYRTSTAALEAPSPLVQQAKSRIDAAFSAARSALLRYQHANAEYLDPRTYAEMPLCYATISGRS